MSATHYAVRVQPGELHFNAAHFITFAQTCENLHGHNFHVRIDARGDNTDDAFVVDFVELNRLAAGICAELHDGVLIPEHNPAVDLIPHDGDMLEIRSYDKRFILCAASCIRLPVPNTTAEMLARHISDRLLDQLRDTDALGNLTQLEVAVEEADRQWGICCRDLRDD